MMPFLFVVPLSSVLRKNFKWLRPTEVDMCIYYKNRCWLQINTLTVSVCGALISAKLEVLKSFVTAKKLRVFLWECFVFAAVWPGKVLQAWKASLSCHSHKNTSWRSAFSFPLSSLPLANLINKPYILPFQVLPCPLTSHSLNGWLTLFYDIDRWTSCSSSLSHLYILHTNDDIFLKTLFLLLQKNDIFFSTLAPNTSNLRIVSICYLRASISICSVIFGKIRYFLTLYPFPNIIFLLLNDFVIFCPLYRAKFKGHLLHDLFADFFSLCPCRITNYYLSVIRHLTTECLTVLFNPWYASFQNCLP